MLASTSSNLSNNGSYGNERGTPAVETDYNVSDPASGSFFHADYKKHDDLKEMLDSNKDSLKLEAMKRIIGMVAKGRDASELFPAVVKNVVSKNIEVKKLVYVYLVRYAEEQQDLVLLSISTFQRALKEPNQLIRASALRVLSSIRVTMIVPIVMLAIRDAAADMSPYVRKTAAHAIPKLYSLDNEQKPELVSIIERLLGDRTTLVVGSAVMAFTEVCPERVDLIHKVYRKLCNLLVDVDEWGQIVIINMLTRYARTQFLDPNITVAEDEDSDMSDGDSLSEKSGKISIPILDPDHRLLLRSARPLLQSRNAAVVMSVAQLYHHIAPRSECVLAARALVRLLRSHSEVQSVVLDGIASISVQKTGMFEPYLKSFFVRTSDLTRIKLLKLDILTNLATESNISVILRELRTYIFSSDKQFVAATIQAIGRCACSISDVTDSCLNGLVSLLSSRDEAVVAESVVVIKRLLQTRAAEPHEIVTHMTKLLDNITVAQARAAILWLLGEHSHGITGIAPDVLRKLAKTFCQEHDIVKLQILNLAVKLYITNPKQTKLLCQYVFNLARYDQNYDIRDRARLLKYFIQMNDTKTNNAFFSEHAHKIFLVPKPAPFLQSRFKDRVHLQLGSLSHYINVRANGYQALPPFPTEVPPGHVRNVDPVPASERPRSSEDNDKKEMFYWESRILNLEDSESDIFSEESNEEEEKDDEKDESDEDESSESEEDESEEEYSQTENKHKSQVSKSKASKSSDEAEDSSSEEEESSDSENEEPLASSKSNKAMPTQPGKESSSNQKQCLRSYLDLLLDLEDMPTITPVMTPSLGGFLTPVSNAQSVAGMVSSGGIQLVPPSYVPLKNIDLLDKISGRGLTISYRYTRTPHLFSPHMVNIALIFTNSSQEEISEIKIGKKTVALGMLVHDFACVSHLAPYSSLPGTLGIDFNDSTQAATLEIVSSVGSSFVSIKPPVGELLRPVTMLESLFKSEQTKLKGMNEHSAIIKMKSGLDLNHTVVELANCSSVVTALPDTFRYAAQTLANFSLVLITFVLNEDELHLTINCEKIVVGSMLLNDLKTALQE